MSERLTKVMICRNRVPAKAIANNMMGELCLEGALNSQKVATRWRGRMRFECACEGSAADDGGQCLVGDWESPARGRGRCRGWTLLVLLSDTEQSETETVGRKGEGREGRRRSRTSRRASDEGGWLGWGWLSSLGQVRIGCRRRSSRFEVRQRGGGLFGVCRV